MAQRSPASEHDPGYAREQHYDYGHRDQDRETCTLKSEPQDSASDLKHRLANTRAHPEKQIRGTHPQQRTKDQRSDKSQDANLCLMSHAVQPRHAILRISHTLHNHRNPLPTPDASRSQPILLLPPPQFIQQSNHQPSPRSPQRMPQSNRPTIHIYLAAI
jgi:hypothetical protein